MLNKRNTKNILIIWIGTATTAIAALLTQILAAKALGTQGYGVISTALAISTIAAPIVVFGITEFWLKAFGEEGWSATRWLKPSLKFIAISCIITITIIILWAIVGPNDQITQFSIISLATVTASLVLTEVTIAKLQLEHNYKTLSIFTTLSPILRLPVAAVALHLSADPHEALLITILGYAGVAIVTIAITLPNAVQIWNLEIQLKEHGSRPNTHNNKMTTIRDVASKSWVFGSAGLLYLAWAQGHVLIANYTLSSADAGNYNAALVFLSAVCLLPTSAYSKLIIPKIHIWATRDIEKLLQFNKKSSEFMFMAGLITSTAIYVYAEELMRISFGHQFHQSAEILRIIAFTLPMRFLGYSAGALLRTQSAMRNKLMLLTIAAAFNGLLAVAFVPRWGVIGLAATIPITEAALVMIYVIYAKKLYQKT